MIARVHFQCKLIINIFRSGAAVILTFDFVNGHSILYTRTVGLLKLPQENIVIAIIILFAISVNGVSCVYIHIFRAVQFTQIVLYVYKAST